MVFTVLLTGCSKTGEEKSVEYIKKRLNVPNSFVKVAYEINKDTGLAWLDYKAKNKMGVELTGRAYFRVSNNGVRYIDTEDVEQVVLDFLEKNYSADFESQVENYKIFANAVKGHAFDITYFIEKVADADFGNYYDLLSLKNSAKSYNKGLRKIKESYGKLSPNVRIFLEKEFPDFKKLQDIKYYKVGLTGNSLNWDVDFKNTGFTTTYPD